MIEPDFIDAICGMDRRPFMMARAARWNRASHLRRCELCDFPNAASCGICPLFAGTNL